MGKCLRIKQAGISNERSRYRVRLHGQTASSSFA